MSNYWTPYELEPGQQLDLLVVLDHMTAVELEGGWFTSEESEYVLDYLDAFEDKISWGVCSLFPTPIDKPKAADIKQHAPALLDTVGKVYPRVVLAMGGSALKALWPDKDFGPFQSVTKAKAMDLKLGGIHLVTTFAPKGHMWFLRSEGRVGSDLSEEYTRVFTKVADILDGVYVPRTFVYTEINSAEDAAWLLARKRELGVSRLGFDTEDTTWWEKDLQPHKWEAQGITLPSKLTMWHKDTELSWCSITWKLPGGGYETFSLHPRVMTTEFVTALFRNMTVSAWNSLYEIASMWRFCGFDMCDPQHRITIFDGMIRYAVRDQSITAIGLKQACQLHIGAPAWDLELHASLNEARARRAEQCGVGIAAIDDVPDAIGRKYNAADTYYMVVLEEEYLIPNRDGGLHPECRAYENLINAIPFFAMMERTGTFTDVPKLRGLLAAQEAEIAKLDSELALNPAIAYVSSWLGEPFSVTRPLHFRALLALTYGSLRIPEPLSHEERKTLKAADRKALKQKRMKEACGVPPWHLRTNDGKGNGVGTGVSAIKLYAAGGIDGYLEGSWQAFTWGQLLKRKQLNDDLLKYYSILNYVGYDNHIHASYRIVRSMNENSDKNSEKGAQSGRTSTTPNSQNRKPITKPCFPAPPGFKKVVIDVKGAEMRIIGHNTQDPLFCKWAREGKDTHLELGAQLWGYATGRDPEEFFLFRSREECAELDEPAPEQVPWRRVGKTLNFSGLYKEEPESFAAKVGITVEEARARATERRIMAPGIYEAEKMIYERLERGLPIITSMFGRVRYAHGWVPTGLPADEFLSFDPEVKRRRNSGNMKLYRSLWNTWGAQADANDIVIYKGACIAKLLYSGYFDPAYIQIDNFIHDAIVFDIFEPYVEQYTAALNHIFQSSDFLPAPLSVPLGTSVEVGDSMGSLKPYKIGA